MTTNEVRGKTTAASTPGSFAPHTRSVSETELPTAPQANQLSRIPAVLASIQEGADSAVDISEALGVDARQGAYYAGAAVSLGMAARVRNDERVRYVLTETGEAVVEADAATAAALLSDAAESSDVVQVLRVSGPDGLFAHLTADRGLSDETASRRVASAEAWAGFVDRHSELADDIEGDSDDVRERARLIAARRPVQRAQVDAVCGSCFMQLPLSGVCGC